MANASPWVTHAYMRDLTWERESTKYTGMHWTEFFTIKGDTLVGRSGEFLVNIG